MDVPRADAATLARLGRRQGGDPPRDVEGHQREAAAEAEDEEAQVQEADAEDEESAEEAR